MELTEKELQDKIDAGISAATDGLKTKNSDLISNIQSLKDKAKVFEGVDIVALQASADELVKLKEANLSDDDKRKRDAKALADANSKTATDLAAANLTIAGMKKDAAVNAAVVEAGTVNKGMFEAVSGLIKSKTTMSDDNVPMIGDKTVAEHVKEWREGEGKMFFVPPNSGGGAGGDGEEASEYAKFFDKKDKAYNMTRQSELYKKNPALYKQLKGDS